MTVKIKSPLLPEQTFTHVELRTLSLTADSFEFTNNEPGHTAHLKVKRHAGLEIELKFDQAKED